MNETRQSADTPDLRDVVGPIWRRRWLVLAIVVASTVGTYVASSQSDKRYRSTTRVFAANSQVQTIVAGSASPATDRTTLDQARVLVSRPVTDAVREQLSLRESARELLKTVSATPDTGSNYVVVSATRGSPDEAAAVANTFVQNYRQFRGQQLGRELDAAIRRVRQQVAGLPPGGAAAQEQQSLQATIGQLQAARAVAPSQARQDDEATPPTAPSSPRPKRDALFAAGISLLLAVGLAFGLDRFDRRVKRVEEIADLYGIPLLTTIPHVESPVGAVDGKPVVPARLREPLRGLRTNIQLASLDQSLRRLTVTSAVPGEGKSTVVRNLALTYREWGMNVVVLEADLRRPSLSRAFGFEATEIGLTSVLTGEVGLDDALLEIPVDSADLEFLDRVRSVGERVTADAATDRSRSATETRLALLPSGPTPPNPEAVLATDRSRQLLEQLTEWFDIVLIDTPPLLSVSDAIPFVTQSDGVIVVSRIGLTERGSAVRVMDAVGRVPNARVLGVVANDLPSEPGSGYGYGYGYGYSNNGKA